MQNKFLISIIVPCYNEADNIFPLLARIKDVLHTYNYEIILINDGSTDATQQNITLVAQEDNSIKYIHFSRNFGHQAAIKAGIDYANGDCMVTIDADLQQPPETILKMLNEWQKGFNIVTAIRKENPNLPLFKKLTSKGFYWFLSLISDQKETPQGADFRLFDKKIAEVIKKMPEKNLYLRGLFSWIGFSQTTIYYKEEERIYGTTKYTSKKMFQLASNGITSSSVKPLRIALNMGVFFAFLAFAYGIYAIAVLFLGLTVSGWTSTIATIVFLAGIQLIVLGVIGEYLGKLYIEYKQRPLYLIADTNILPYKNEFTNPKLERSEP